MILPNQPFVEMPVNHLVGIVDTVQTIILKSALHLEQEGILGDSLAFSNEEKQRATQNQSVRVHGNNYGPIGHGSGPAIQVGDFGLIYEQLKDAGVSQTERNEIEIILDELKKAEPEERKSWAQKGMDWLGKNAKNIGEIAGALRTLFGRHLPPGE